MPLFEKDHSDVWAGLASQELNIAKDAFLNALRNLVGVTQGFICAEDGAIQDAYVAGEWNKTQAAELSAQLAQLLATFQTQGNQPREIELRCERGGIFVRALGNAFAFVLCEPNLDWAILRMSMNVAAAAYEAASLRAAHIITAGGRLD
ncbi:MAG: hypothetical protein HY868_26960 [Chloroflexi bacterium]|nr:hypothetical protein [Chloroflexota bacterium]